MAIVDVGKTHSESISVSVFQTGTNRCDVILKNALFGDIIQSDEYVVGVESLQCPMGGTTYLSSEPHNALLVSIRRRRDGEPFDVPHTHLYPDTIADQGVFGPDADAEERSYTVSLGAIRSDRFIIREFGDFMELLNQWSINFSQTLRSQAFRQVTGFNQDWDNNQIDGENLSDDDKKIDHLMCRVTPSGSVSISASNLFWSNFFLEFSGYAQEILGFPQYVTFTEDGVVASRGTGAVAGEDEFTFIAAGTGVETMESFFVDEEDFKVIRAVSGDRSIWGSLETRLSVSLATSIPLQRSLIISDNIESRTFALGSWSLNNEVKTIFSIAGPVFASEFQVETEGRSGHVVLKDSSTPVTEFLHLRPDVGLRNLRLSLYIRERVFADGKWAIVLKELPVKPWETWNCKLLFVRKT